MHLWDTFPIINLKCLQGHGGEGRRDVLPELPGAADAQVGLRLAQVHLLQDRDLLGDTAATMGSKCECVTATSSH